ncbi:MAG: YdcF family protein [Lachnospiraceae bacterium]|nr:YdcF family protein [Lachnospiraceae bacterium]
MSFAFISFGIFCIVYYMVLYLYTRRWNTTFAAFWPVFGIVNVGFGLLVNTYPQWIRHIILGVVAIPWLVFFVVEIIICVAMLARPPKELEYIIILGAQVRKRKITDALKRRLDKGIQYINENPDTKIIVSGGKGAGEEISEAEAMKIYLQSRGIDSAVIILEDQSTNTKENLAFSGKFLNPQNMNIGIVTNNFHVYRAVKQAEAQGYKNVYGIAASCRAVIFLNYMVREFFAILQMSFQLRKRH